MLRPFLLSLFILLSLNAKTVEGCFAWCKKPVRKSIISKHPDDVLPHDQPMIITYADDPGAFLIFRAIDGNADGARKILAYNVEHNQCLIALDLAKERGHTVVANIIKEHLDKHNEHTGHLNT